LIHYPDAPAIKPTESVGRKTANGGCMAGRFSWLEKLTPDSGTVAKSISRLEQFVMPESGRAERRFVEHFAAYRWNGSTLEQDMVRDISATGVYLLTKERWRLGTIVSLTMQREGPLELDPTRRITTQARVVRCGEDGVGLSFIWSKHDPRSLRWESLVESVIELTKPDEMLGLARTVESLAFLSRICPDGMEEIEHWVRTRASNHKAVNAVSIALRAEDLFIRSGATGDVVRVNPQVAVRILEGGSSTDEDWLHDFWAGLLITSCSADGRDESNLEFVGLFSQLTLIPIRIFTVVCTRATKVISESGTVFARPLACNLKELVATVGSRVTNMERDLGSLSELQLIERRIANNPTLLASDEIHITPTALALRLFALCNGHRGTLRSFYSLRF
jgi:hypothetical protein